MSGLWTLLTVEQKVLLQYSVETSTSTQSASTVVSTFQVCTDYSQY